MSTKRSPYKKSEASRKLVLDAAIALIAERGFSRVSVQDIAEGAKMSKGAVHYHFENKDDLIRRVLLHCTDTLAARARAAWEVPGTPSERIRRAITEMWAVRKEGGVEFRALSDLMAQGVHDEHLRPPLAEMFRHNREEILAASVQRFIDLGLRPRVDPRVIPRLLLATLDGLAVQHVFDPPSTEEEAEIMRALEMTAFALFEF